MPRDGGRELRQCRGGTSVERRLHLHKDGSRAVPGHRRDIYDRRAAGLGPGRLAYVQLPARRRQALLRRDLFSGGIFYLASESDLRGLEEQVFRTGVECRADCGGYR